MPTRISIASALAVAAAAAGCGQSGEPRRGSGTFAERDDTPRLYQASAMVLEGRQHGPMLCLGAVLTSLPPQCGDVPLEGWNWASVSGERRAGGSTWGMYNVTGTYGDGRFTVVEVGPYVAAPEPEPDFSSPCPTPTGGWSGLENATQNDDSGVFAYARRQPDYVTSWITHLDPKSGERSPVIVNLIFTGDADRHESEIRKLWSGPLCVIAQAGPTEHELRSIRREAEAAVRQMGLQMLWSDGPGLKPVIDIGVVIDPDGKAQAAFDERFGTGRVRVSPALKPA
jgi:hypothetical protein